MNAVLYVTLGTALIAALASTVGVWMQNRSPSAVAQLVATLHQEIGRLQARVDHLESENEQLHEDLRHAYKRRTDRREIV